MTQFFIFVTNIATFPFYYIYINNGLCLLSQYHFRVIYEVILTSIYSLEE